MTVSIAYLSPLSGAECPSWCVAHRMDADGELLHLGETVEVSRRRSSATRSSSFELRLVAREGERPSLLLDDVQVSTHALLSELKHAARVSTA